MKRLQAFKFELRPDGAAQRAMRRHAGACRFVYNKALALQQARYANGEKKLSYVEVANLLPAWKAEFTWLNEAPSQALQQALKDLDRAYINFFEKRAALPRFHKKGQRDSFRFPQGITLDAGNSRVKLPKLGWVRYRKSRDVLGTIKNATLSQTSSKWFVSLQTERDVVPPMPTSTSAVGVDMGVARFATLSDGEVIQPLNSFRRHEVRLRRYQRAMSRKTKFSNNWKKAKARLQRVHSHIAAARRDFLHKASRTLSKNHAMVCIEDLKVANMTRSAAGTVDAPGRNVRQKSGLNKSILDQGWAEFRRQLDYKLAWNGGWLITVPPHHTSQACPDCGHTAAENRQTQARFACVKCGFEAHADWVGATNVLRRGLAQLSNEGQDDARIACGERALSGHSRKQEPTEASQAQKA